MTEFNGSTVIGGIAVEAKVEDSAIDGALERLKRKLAEAERQLSLNIQARMSGVGMAGPNVTGSSNGNVTEGSDQHVRGLREANKELTRYASTSSRINAPSPRQRAISGIRDPSIRQMLQRDQALAAKWFPELADESGEVSPVAMTTRRQRRRGMSDAKRREIGNSAPLTPQEMREEEASRMGGEGSGSGDNSSLMMLSRRMRSLGLRYGGAYMIIRAATAAMEFSKAEIDSARDWELARNNTERAHQMVAAARRRESAVSSVPLLGPLAVAGANLGAAAFGVDTASTERTLREADLETEYHDTLYAGMQRRRAMTRRIATASKPWGSYEEDRKNIAARGQTNVEEINKARNADVQKYQPEDMPEEWMKYLGFAASPTLGGAGMAWHARRVADAQDRNATRNTRRQAINSVYNRDVQQSDQAVQAEQESSRWEQQVRGYEMIQQANTGKFAQQRRYGEARVNDMAANMWSEYMHTPEELRRPLLERNLSQVGAMQQEWRDQAQSAYAPSMDATRDVVSDTLGLRRDTGGNGVDFYQAMEVLAQRLTAAIAGQVAFTNPLTQRVK